MNFFRWFEAHRNPIVPLACRLGERQVTDRVGMAEHAVVALASTIPILLPKLIAIADALGRRYLRLRGPRRMPAMSHRASDVSVVIVTWNGASLLPRCLTSLRSALAVVPGRHEVIVVDNGSTDDTASSLAADFPEVRVIALRRNRGFAIANNIGVRRARRDLVLLLNNDMVLPESSLKSLLRHFHDSVVFAVAPKVEQPDGTLCEGHSWSHFRDGMLYFANERQYPGGLMIDHSAPTLYAIGGCALFDRRAYWRLGGLDTLFAPFCWEDDDIGYRAMKRGMTVLYDPSVCAVHDNSATMNSAAFSPAYVRAIKEKNLLLFFWKNLADPPFLAAYLAAVPGRIELLKSRKGYLELLAYVLAFLQIGTVMRRRVCEAPWIRRTDGDVIALTGAARHDAKPTGGSSR